jgi:putative transcriptional regulator
LAYILPVDFEWDDAKDLSNQEEHGLSFAEARRLFESGADYLEIFDAEHSDFEDRFIAIGPIDRGLVVVVYTEREEEIIRIIGGPHGHQARAGPVPLVHGSTQMTDIPELTDEQLKRAIPARVRKRLIQGRFESGEDIAALRSFVGLTQAEFARAIEISVHTLRNWEQGRRKPEGPAIALLRIAARHPRIIRENLESAA